MNFELSFVGFLLGIILGSFVKLLADRSLSGISFGGRSKCPHCGNILNWYDLIPLLSFIFLQGKCRYCQKKISFEYPLVEIFTGVLIAMLFSIPQSSANLIFKTFFISILVAVTVTDLKEMIIPDRVILPSIVIAFIGVLILSFYPTFNPAYLVTNVLSGVTFGGFFLLLIIITRGRGMGGGDVKLGAFIGLVLGFPHFLLAIMLSFLTGAVISIILVFGGKKGLKSTIPFGPFLVLGSLITLFWGNKIIDWYLKLGS